MLTPAAASAVLSPCRRYRYALRRCWEPALPAVLFIGLNPSTADAEHDDATSRVCINYARRWGFGTLLLGNLFAWRSRDPAVLSQVPDPVGPDNDRHLKRLQARAALVLCAWGDPGALLGRDEQVLGLLKAPHCLTRLRSGRPGHPLYKRAGLLPVPLG
ncbi:DUF1643 domain-containing protein [Aquabacterium sp. OR-4]|uniref:DUF1643 domain-containing protein n=1 Tax=Aquabacterium sp. OR-4 TaxID=2978127 RepID=UPI0021B47122|nr:DUF1643 domain-containing protein [Aquabacterium sp. OR-4]MDT7833729.1 DUF1643 domain-containing protein [Aquabacterium sp. OR-4]